MKKIFSLAAIAMVASTMFTSCSKDDSKPTPPPVGTPELTLTVAPASVEVNAEGTFTVTSNIDATADIVVTVKSGDDKIITVAPASVTIAKGTKTATGKFTGVAEGSTKITIEATGITLKVSSVDVTVKAASPELPEGEIVTANVLCDKDNVWSEEWFAEFTVDAGTTTGFTLWYNEKVLLENVGCNYVGSSLSLTAVDKGTEISSLTFTENLEHELMGVNGGTGYDILPNFTTISGEQYVVFCVPRDIVPIIEDDTIQNTEECTHDKPQVKGWALVSVSGDGQSVTLKACKFPATKVGE